MDAILKNNFKNILAGYQKIADYTVSGSAITSYDLTGLNITKEDDYMLVSSLVNSSGGNQNSGLFFNGNNTETNYYHQYDFFSTTDIAAGRQNNPRVLNGITNGNSGFTITSIKLTNNGYVITQNNTIRNVGSSGIILSNQYGTSTFTLSSITSIRIYSAETNAISAGSRFQLYKRVAPIIADITVSTATTSVDITGFTMDKGSEYMLVSDVVNGSSINGCGYNLLVNGNNTQTNYYSQWFYTSNGTTISANRQNAGSFAYNNDVGSRNFTVSKLKLLNSGYFALHNNGVKKYGGSNIDIFNTYNTSTFTSSNITSIRLLAEHPNGIGVGSRFQLIKLK